MTRREGLVLRSALVATGITALVGAVIAASFFKRTAPAAASPPAAAQAAELSVFAAPSHIPEGESWVLLGSQEENLPADLVLLPNGAGVLVLEVQTISERALGVRLQVSALATGKLLRVSSISRGAETHPELYRGQAAASLSADANFTQEDLTDGRLIVPSAHFMYGYFPGSDVALGAVRIHNRATGKWYSHEIALEKALKAAQPAVVIDDPAFVNVDPHDTLPDTDGDGVPDFDEEPEPREPVPQLLGVELEPGVNTLDLVAVDEAGNASWRTIEVLSTSTPNAGGF